MPIAGILTIAAPGDGTGAPAAARFSSRSLLDLTGLVVQRSGRIPLEDLLLQHMKCCWQTDYMMRNRKVALRPGASPIALHARQAHTLRGISGCALASLRGASGARPQVGRFF